MTHKRYSFETLEKKPTISDALTGALKIHTENHRYWISGYGIEEGEPFEHTIYVESKVDGRWVLLDCYNGDSPNDTVRPAF